MKAWFPWRNRTPAAKRTPRVVVGPRASSCHGRHGPEMDLTFLFATAAMHAACCRRRHRTQLGCVTGMGVVAPSRRCRYRNSGRLSPPASNRGTKGRVIACLVTKPRSFMRNVTSERRCGCAQRPSTATMPRVHVLSASPTGVPSVSLAATGWHTSVNRHTPISRRPYGNGYQTLVRCSGGSVISPRADRIQIAQYFPVVLTGTVLLRIRISRPAASDGHLKGYPAIFLHARYSSKLDMTATTPLRRSMSLG